MATLNLDNVNDKNVCLILLIGLPGAGKTFLTNFLVNRLQSATLCDVSKVYFTDLCVVPITYDDYIIYDHDSIKDWKNKRKMVFSSVEEFILYFKGLKTTLDDNLYNINNTPFCNYSQCTEKRNLFIIIDDNMYYKSMRFEYFKLAKKHEISFCQIYLESTLENALEYNKKRVNVVPDNVISKMHKKIEIPSPAVNSWECNSLTVPAFIQFDDKSDDLCNIIVAALQSPEKYKNSLENFNQENCKKITDTNLIHQIDIRLRNLISFQINEMKQSFDKNELKYAAEHMNKERLKLMKDIKSSILMLPSELVNILQSPNKSIDDDNIVNNYLLDKFTLDFF